MCGRGGVEMNRKLTWTCRNNSFIDYLLMKYVISDLKNGKVKVKASKQMGAQCFM